MPLPLKRSASRLPESFTTLRQDQDYLGGLYAGASRMSQVAESLGCLVERFGYETDYDFDLPSRRSYFLEYQAHVVPDEILYAPRCGLWSRMQAINATTEAKKDLLQQQRQLHHDHHLRFVKKSYLAQVQHILNNHMERFLGKLHL